jgi:sulfatase maturation enzyme AslB (radical SAM superfamily)
MKFSSIAIIILQNIKIWIFKALSLEHKLVPYKVLISLTNQCNSRCVYCDIWKINSEDKSKLQAELKLEELDSVFSDLGEHLIWLSLSGGEVTLVPYFKEMVLSAKKHCKNLKVFTFTTNALAPDRAVEYAIFTKKLGLDVFITISLDGDEETHDALRGIKGNFKKCVRLYEMLRTAGVNAHYGVTVGDGNEQFIKNDFPKMASMIRSVTFVHSGGIYHKENASDNSIMLKSLALINNCYKISNLSEIIEKIHIKVSYFMLQNNMKKSIIPCDVLNSSIHIMPYGEIKPCMYMPEIGNIRQSGILKSLMGPFSAKSKADIKNDQCPHCWMNCYSPYSIMQHPFLAIKYLFREIK